MKQAFLDKDSAENEVAKLKRQKRTNITIKMVVCPKLGELWTVTSELKLAKGVKY